MEKTGEYVEISTPQYSKSLISIISKHWSSKRIERKHGSLVNCQRYDLKTRVTTLACKKRQYLAVMWDLLSEKSSCTEHLGNGRESILFIIKS